MTRRAHAPSPFAFPLRLSHWMKGFALALPLFGNPAFAQDASAGPAGGVYNLLVGTYTGSGSDGIYVYRFDTDSGRVSPVSSAKAENPSYLVARRAGRPVYAVNELPGDAGPASVRGGVSAFDFDAKTGALKFVNRVSAQGNDPCYLSLSPDGRYLVVANYSVASDPGGSFSVFPVEATGARGAAGPHAAGASHSAPAACSGSAAACAVVTAAPLHDRSRVATAYSRSPTRSRARARYGKRSSLRGRGSSMHTSSDAS